MIVYW